MDQGSLVPSKRCRPSWHGTDGCEVHHGSQYGAVQPGEAEVTRAETEGRQPERVNTAASPQCLHEPGKTAARMCGPAHHSCATPADRQAQAKDHTVNRLRSLSKMA